MDIIKRLQLQETSIKNTKSGTIVGAKNMIVNSVGSYLTTEYGFSVAFESGTDENIIGIIPCNEELVILTYDYYKRKSNIYRLKDNDEEIPKFIDNINWDWEGGKIEGSFAYNYKGDLILAIAEYGVEGKDIPLKIINLDDNNKNLSGNLEEDIPQINSDYVITNEGSLVCGVYTFFIRFKISEQSYTKWFQISDDIIITNLIEKEKPVHNYNDSNNSKKTANTSDFLNLFINDNLISSSSIKFTISFDDCNFDKYQLGYVIKRNNEILGRYYKEFNTSDINVEVLDNTFLEEVNINDFLEFPTQFFNVKNIINYNNRLYISNYKEKEDPNIEDIVSDIITPKIKLLKLENNINKSIAKLTITAGVLYQNEWSDTKTTKILDLELTSLNNLDSIQFVEDNIYPLCQRGDYSNSDKALYLFKENDKDINNAICIYSTINEIQADDSYTIEFSDNKINIIKDGEKYILNGKDKFAILIYNNSDNTYFWGREPYVSFSIDNIESPNYISYLSSSYSSTTNTIINNIYNNNRTLIPGQVYNLFVHFIRKDGSFTQGYKLNNKIEEDNSVKIIPSDINVNTKEYDFVKKDTFFQCPIFENQTIPTVDFIIVPVFKINENNESYSNIIKNNFIGYFISYEDIEITSIPVVSLDSKKPESNNVYHYTNSEILYNDKIIKGHVLSSGLSPTENNRYKTENIKNIYIKTDFYRQKELQLSLEEGNFDSEAWNNDISEPTKSSYKTIIALTKNSLYNSEYKTLYRLTRNIYIDEKEYKTNLAYTYLPGFLNNEKVIYYDRELLFNSVTTYIYDKEGNIINDRYKISSICKNNFSHICLNALSIKEDYEKAAIVLNNTTYVNKVLAPDRLSEFLELKEAYKSKPIISYTNYNKNNQYVFDKRIYRSDVISDESLTNGFRHFNLENYKNILENKGKIVNIVGVGLYLLVHTQYSLFVFDRNNQLTKESQLQIPDVFDIDYKELTPSTEGFGGLYDKKESIVTKHGYIWYDRKSASIFIFNGQKIEPISADISELLDEIKNNELYTLTKVRFAEDYITNRLLICIELGSNYYITLSYSFITNSFISTHNYRFSDSYKTYNNSYLFDYSVSKKLYKFDKKSTDYKELTTVQNSIRYPNILDNENNICSYIDIIFTDLYEKSKVLNSISYIISKDNNQIPINFNKLYSGYRMEIGTDLTYSGILNIEQDKIEIDNKESTAANLINSEKPHFDKGVWNFNNFRNDINKPVDDWELRSYKYIPYWNENTNKIEIKEIDLNELKETYRKTSQTYTSSDLRSLIYGKYFIIRFIFQRNTVCDIKLETLDVNISRY